MARGLGLRALQDELLDKVEVVDLLDRLNTFSVGVDDRRFGLPIYEDDGSLSGLANIVRDWVQERIEVVCTAEGSVWPSRIPRLAQGEVATLEDLFQPHEQLPEKTSMGTEEGTW